jgi:hypothetical protein
VSKPKEKPINKRYPGEHTARLQVWMPDGSWLKMDGPVSKKAASAMVVAFTTSKREKPGGGNERG